MILDRVAEAIDWIQPPPVYIGGAVVPLFLDEFGKSQMRPTKDVDCIVPEVLSHLQYTELETQLRLHGWAPDPSGPICRYLGPADLVVDFMPENPNVLGFAGRWYPEAIKSASPRKLSSGRVILLPRVSHLFACKLEAFFDRGVGDPFASTDLEDISAIMDGCEGLDVRIKEAPVELQKYIQSQIHRLANDKTQLLALEAQLPRGGDEDARIEKLQRLVRQLGRP